MGPLDVILGYNTNGMAHHDLVEAIDLLGQIGYRSVAITIDHHAISPRDPRLDQQIAQVRQALSRWSMRSVIETGARFLLDPRQKHEPTLLSADADARRRRVDFYGHAIRCAAELGSDCMSLWSGVLRDSISEDAAMDRLVDGLERVLEMAAGQGVVVGFEPEPGMFIDTLQRFEDLEQRLRADHFRLTLDVGHLHCQGELPLADLVRRFGPRLANVHLEDMRKGIHEHLMFGEGEIDFPPVLLALSEAGFRGGVHVELSRHSHDAVRAAQQAFAFLQSLLP